MPVKLCECGCGLPAPIAPQTNRKMGWIKGQPTRFRKGHHGKGKRGGDHNRWKSGKTKHPQGYILVFCPGHPRAYRDRYVFEHILVMEKFLGRYLEKHEIVHHKNEDKTDNRLDNLELTNRENHSRHHRLIEGRRGRPEVCSIENCNLPYHSSGFCRNHYGQHIYNKHKIAVNNRRRARYHEKQACTKT